MIVDSSFLVALFDPDDIFHDKAARLLEINLNATLVIPNRVIEETITVLAHKKNVAFALQVLEKLRDNKQVAIKQVSEDEWNEVISLMAERNRPLGFVDYLVILLSNRIKEKPLCFDEKLLKEVKV